MVNVLKFDLFNPSFIDFYESVETYNFMWY